MGSVCSGVGGFDLGFRNAGYRTAWMCEYDPWRQKVLAHHWPGVPIHPDLTTLDPADLEPVDVLIGGTPCQDLSVAGRRAGLDGERSRLFWDFIRVRNVLGVRWAVWENVAGALSSNRGVDFASVLGAFVGATVDVPAGGWGGAGVVTGAWGGAVWRLLDAQHFGVPQRRRRVFVVGHLGGPCPPEVLFEPACGDGDSAPGGQAREGAPADVVSGVAGTLGSHTHFRGDLDGHGAYIPEPVAKSLTTKQQRYGDGSEESFVIAHTLRAEGFDASEDGTGRGTPLTVTRGVVDHEGERSDLRPRTRAADNEAQRGSGSLCEGLHGAPPDAHGVRAADGLAGRVDRANGFDEYNQVLTGDTAACLRVDQPWSLALVEGGSGNRSAYDPRPDGRRYAACGDGVVAPVAEWIARRLRPHIEACE